MHIKKKETIKVLEYWNKSLVSVDKKLNWYIFQLDKIISPRSNMMVPSFQHRNFHNKNGYGAVFTMG